MSQQIKRFENGFCIHHWEFENTVTSELQNAAKEAWEEMLYVAGHYCKAYCRPKIELLDEESGSLRYNASDHFEWDGPILSPDISPQNPWEQELSRPQKCLHEKFSFLPNILDRVGRMSLSGGEIEIDYCPVCAFSNAVPYLPSLLRYLHPSYRGPDSLRTPPYKATKEKPEWLCRPAIGEAEDDDVNLFENPFADEIRPHCVFTIDGEEMECRIEKAVRELALRGDDFDRLVPITPGKKEEIWGALREGHTVAKCIYNLIPEDIGQDGFLKVPMPSTKLPAGIIPRYFSYSIEDGEDWPEEDYCDGSIKPAESRKITLDLVKMEDGWHWKVNGEDRGFWAKQRDRTKKLKIGLILFDHIGNGWVSHKTFMNACGWTKEEYFRHDGEPGTMEKQLHKLRKHLGVGAEFKKGKGVKFPDYVIAVKSPK